MDSNKSLLLHLILFFLVVDIASSSHLSNGIFEPQGTIGRSLLQQKTTCPVDFENMNYTVITSQCKGPNYSADRCCPPLKQLLCPVKDQINDLKSDCADVFFSYVNLYGKYPPGLFASLCKEGKEGLNCEGVVVAKNGASCAAASSSLVMVIAALALIMFCYI